ncbi:MAG: thioredoxin family protein [Chitinophagaceae bacterium]|nr:thioredoxin family protein [Chitinophagaceae bacterium]
MKSSFLVITVLCIVMTQLCVHAQTNTPFANIEVKNSNGEPMLLGHCNISFLQQGIYKNWYQTGYDHYLPDSSTIPSLTGLLKGKQIDIFLGTWCGDSRREVPRMLKILTQAGVQQQQIRLIFVSNESNSYKQSPQHEEAGKNIKRVPTFIVYENEKEMGRIIEYPVVSLEKDLLSILRREKYVPNYHQL